MDGDVGRWILEYLLRSSVPDSIVKKLLKALPISGVDSRLRKTLLLRTIQSEVSSASFTETTLDALEIIEELDRIDGIAITEMMKQAYFSVALDCTLRHLNNKGLYLDAVKGIWWGRIREMEAAAAGERSELFTDALVECKRNIEAALRDSMVCDRLANWHGHCQSLVISRVRAYLQETWGLMGPPFLELAAKFPIKRTEIQKGKLPLKHKQRTRSSIRSRGVKIIDVEDPLPDASHNADILRSELAMEGISHELPLENQGRDVEAREPNTCRSIVLYQPIDFYRIKNSPVNCSNGHPHNVMEGNRAAHNHEWNNPIDNLPVKMPIKRRRVKRWSSLEEETLIAGVKMFGKGQWQEILNFYSQIFNQTGRTAVDLKDKWRNMRVT